MNVKDDFSQKNFIIQKQLNLLCIISLQSDFFDCIFIMSTIAAS